MLLGILLTIHILVSIALTGVVLLQRSEGGALGMGGGPTGFMTARGAGDLLTRTTWILFAAFLALSLALTLLAGRGGAGSVTERLKIDAIDPNSLNQPPTAPAPATAPAETAPAPLTAPTPTLRTLPSGAGDLGLPGQAPPADQTAPADPLK